MDRNANVVVDLDGTKIVLINDVRFKGKREEWKDTEGDKMDELERLLGE